MSSLSTRLIAFAENLDLVQTLEAKHGDCSATWSFFTQPAQPPVLEWTDSMKSLPPPGAYIADPVLQTMPHGMPWEGRVVMRSPKIVGNNCVFRSEAETEEFKPQSFLAWEEGAYILTEIKTGVMTQTRLFRTPELLARFPELN